MPKFSNAEITMTTTSILRWNDQAQPSLNSVRKDCRSIC
ncbi:hypothetical protein BAAM0483_02320 [Bifidobacterium animalis subsp. animalis MCC 0483]|uniref:Uncharacterized protein n=1 Tax=Bifidobacterium animalis subsp. animalis MCC 0483 TaxID=1365955 RepID=A0AB34TAF7_9BIFI|nr:hypothetical protein BAAM0483_02320 [Bifidobacterium animalis subsp. animalis MCC 0483]